MHPLKPLVPSFFQRQKFTHPLFTSLQPQQLPKNPNLPQPNKFSTSTQHLSLKDTIMNYWKRLLIIFKKRTIAQKKSMKKHPIHLLSLLLLISTALTQTVIFSESQCLGNCNQCDDSNMLECSNDTSAVEEGLNKNCFLLFKGQQCEQLSSGYSILEDGDLNSWDNSRMRKCTTNHHEFDIARPVDLAAPITKKVTVQQQDIEVIWLKITVINPTTSPTPTESNNTETTITNSTTIDENGQVVIIQTIQTLTNTSTQNNQPTTNTYELNISGINNIGLAYQLRQVNHEQTTTEYSCGATASTFLFSVQVTELTELQLSLRHVGAERWSLAEFTMYAGCSGYMFSVGGACNQCMAGYYGVEVFTEGSSTLLECVACESTCRACSSNGRCTLCRDYTTLNPITGKCEYLPNYEVHTQFTPIRGSQSGDTYVANSRNKLRLSIPSNSKENYGLKLTLLYEALKDKVGAGKVKIATIADGVEQVSKQIPVEQLQQYSGTYYDAFNNGNTKIYSTNVEIYDLLADSFEGSPARNEEVLIDVSVDHDSPLQLGATKVELLQQKCLDMCTKCSMNSNTCQQCEGFFDLQSDCKYCSNGFYLKSFWKPDITDSDGNTIQSIQTTQPNICLKCHVSCKQCIDSSLNSCKECYPDYIIDNVHFNDHCIRCLYAVEKGEQTGGQCQRCLLMHPYSLVRRNTFCSECLMKENFDELVDGEDDACVQCWLRADLGYGRCKPDPMMGYSFYGGDASEGKVQKSQWKVQPPTPSADPQQYNCSEDYKNLWGVPPTKNYTQNNYSLIWQQEQLPKHSGMKIFFNIFQVDIKDKSNITVVVMLDKTVILNTVLETNHSAGANICSGAAREMVYTFLGNFDEDKTQKGGEKLSIEISGKKGFFVRQLEVFLGNCEECQQEQLNYQIGFLPRYNSTEMETGMDLWLTFNQPATFKGTDEELKEAFQFTIDKVSDQYLTTTQFKNDLSLNKRLHYYIPLGQTFINGKLTVNTTEEQKFFKNETIAESTSKSRLLTGQNEDRSRILLSSRLSQPESTGLIDRYSQVGLDDRYSMRQIFWFFLIFTWITLIGMIVFSLLGVGVILEDFSIMLQLIFLHVYISSPLLPATFKAPMLGAERMEDLNYFANSTALGIEQQWFGDYESPSPFIFQQYNPDNFFLRAFYPTIIINIVYFAWFMIWLGVHKLELLDATTSRFARFFKNIPSRPINFIDQIWRYQFVTTMFASFVQFYSIRNSTSLQRWNLAILFMSFIISIVWPFFIMIYTFYKTKVKYSTQFLHDYEDIFFKRIPTFGEENSRFYIYIGVRFGRLFFYALFIALFIQHQIIAPVILIVLNIIQLAYVISAGIFVGDYVCTTLKVLENLLLIALEIALLFVYGFSNTMEDINFLDLGYAMIVICVLLVINGAVRFFYYTYCKAYSFYYDVYGQEGGEKKEYGRTPLPNTQRFDHGSN